MQDFFSLYPFYFNVDAFLNIAGSNPFAAMAILFINGGWLLVIFVLIWAARALYLDMKQAKYVQTLEWILLRITVPTVSEQTPLAVENIFANFAGAHSSVGWTEKWFRGVFQQAITVEIASLNGEVSFYVHALDKMRDLIEASIYAQYPDAEIEIVEDYAKNVPAHYPHNEWDVWAVEMTNVMPDPYSLKTFHEFEDKVSGEFKDPMANLLEAFSRFGPGEQAWYQIVMVPTDQKDFRSRAEKLINKMKGVEEKKKRTVLDVAIDIPMKAASDIMTVALASPSSKPGEKKKEDKQFRMLSLSPGEKYVLEAIERKQSKIGFTCKIRFIYVAKKEVMNKSKAANPFIGAIKQMNTFNMQALKPEMKRVGLSSNLWWFKDYRNNIRKTNLVRAYRNRSSWSGLPAFHLSAEELATLWHFPILLQVKAPKLKRIEAKKSEAPANIPFG
jgi:hypothetical protein